ncbi:hypothetical protein [Paenibacillus puerhi]|uniref:hypothetical protein n=1 Tax=Paenibacillus puerhi TaxID=2692622 RepID=UPI001359277C|nr:hypothetical protein [Paenibacillus puerhi]
MRKPFISVSLLVMMLLLVVSPVSAAEQAKLLKIDIAAYWYGPMFSSYNSTSFFYENDYGSVYEVTIKGTSFFAEPLAVTSRDPNPVAFQAQTLYLKTVDQVYEGYPDFVNYSTLSVANDGKFLLNGVPSDTFITYEEYSQTYTTVQIIPTP